MRFDAPGRLWLLLGIAGLIGVYLVAQWQRRGYAARFTNPALLSSVAPRRPGPWRHVAFAALALTLVTLVLGFARPARAKQGSRREATIVLAIDVSDSMAATDVRPSRLVAAQRAAKQFARDVPKQLKLGLVTFGPTADVLVSPTTDRDAVVEALDRLDLSPGTATGDGIAAALSAIGPTDPAPSKQPSASIVLLSDGAANVGRPVEEAERAATQAHVPVSTIAYGTDAGTVVSNGRALAVPVDRDALRQVAETTGGTFFEAATGAELRRVYDGIGTRVRLALQREDLTAWFVGTALLLAFAGGAGSLASTARLP